MNIQNITNKFGIPVIYFSFFLASIAAFNPTYSFLFDSNEATNLYFFSYFKPEIKPLLLNCLSPMEKYYSEREINGWNTDFSNIFLLYLANKRNFIHAIYDDFMLRLAYSITCESKKLAYFVSEEQKKVLLRSLFDNLDCKVPKSAFQECFADFQLILDNDGSMEEKSFCQNVLDEIKNNLEMFFDKISDVFVAHYSRKSSDKVLQ